MTAGIVAAVEIGRSFTRIGASCINAAGVDVSGDVGSVVPTISTEAEVRLAGGRAGRVDNCVGKLATAERAGTLGGTIFGMVPSTGST